MHRGEEVVLLVVENIVAHGNARSYQFGDTSLYQFLGEFRVFQLVAYSHSLTGPDEFGEISVEGMEGESCHLRPLTVIAVVASGECNSQYT